MIIGICGKIGSGKSTLANFLEKLGFEEYSFANPLKKIGKIFGFTDVQLYGTQENKLEIHEKWGISSRTFLQKVGTELFRDILPKLIPEMKINRTVWADIFELDYKNNPRNIVISDVRFEDEAKLIKELGGIVIRTVRENSVISLTREELKHPSELELEKIKEDFLIDNNIESFDSAQKKLLSFLEK